MDKKVTAVKILRVLIPFSLCYFLALLARNIPAVFAMSLHKGLHLSPSSVGFSSSMYLLFFAFFQMPAGVLLDYFQPRRVQVWCFLIGALSLAIYGSSYHTFGLSIGRALLGIGSVAALSGGLKAIYYWFDKRSLPLLNSILQSIGGIGALMATFPTNELMKLITWRGVCAVYSSLFVAVVLILVFVVPKGDENEEETVQEGRVDKPPFQFKELFNYGIIIRNKKFWEIIIPGAVCFGTFSAVQSLWIGPWLEGGLGFSKEKMSWFLFGIALFMILGMLSGHLFIVVGRKLKKSMRITQLFLLSIFTLFLFLGSIEPFSTNIVVWLGFGYFAQAIYMIFPQFSDMFSHEIFGRVASFAAVVIFGLSFFIQIIMGYIVDLWKAEDIGIYPEAAFQAALWFSVILCVLSIAWGYIKQRKIHEA
ncbi:MAG: MFS transporter [Rhabdochlamydiaceae bacterium]|nr:MFS transporter [Candidatus Amphrikana amoebophyrae]